MGRGFSAIGRRHFGLILYSELFEEPVRRLLERKLSAERAKGIVGWISEALLLTVAAQITTTPLIKSTLATLFGDVANQRVHSPGASKSNAFTLSLSKVRVERG